MEKEYLSSLLSKQIQLRLAAEVDLRIAKRSALSGGNDKDAHQLGAVIQDLDMRIEKTREVLADVEAGTFKI